MSGKQQRRADILSRVNRGSVSRAEGARLLGMSDRQMRRLVSRYQEDGIRSVVHGNTGRTPANKLSFDTASAIADLCGQGGKYHGFNTSHARDMLDENEGLRAGRSTVYTLLRNAGIVKLGKQGKQTRRKRRERCSAEGMMVQIDGSIHDWLEGRGPRMSLMGAVDDARGELVYGIFRPTEDQAGYLMMLQSIAVNYGLPEIVYHDRHTILHSPKEATIEDELAGKLPESQLQRVMRELGIESIAAHSPQAKGRVERIWGTLQDRLVKEMRLANICSIDEANDFLKHFIPRYNKRFGREPANPENVWVQLEPGMDIPYYFSTSETRTVKADNTISWQNKTLQILPSATHRRLESKPIDVHVTAEGDIYLYDAKIRLKYKPIQQRQASPQPRPDSAFLKQSPPPDLAAAARKRAWLYGKQTNEPAVL